MMKRLTESDNAMGSPEDCLAQLLRMGIPSRPEAFRKQRVWSSVLRMRKSRVARRRRLVVGLALLVGLSAVVALVYRSSSACWPFATRCSTDAAARVPGDAPESR